MRGEFEAQWATRCARCDGRIHEGDRCRYTDDDQIVHVDCAGLVQRPTRAPVAICPRCYLTRPCEHDE